MVSKCYYCGLPIEDERELVEKKYPLVCKNGKVRNYRRKFHINCVTKYNESMKIDKQTKQEDNDWDKVYQKFRDLLGYKASGVNLNNHAVLRLRGLRIGKYVPNGENVKNLRRGYSYDTIYKTILFVSDMIRDALNGNYFHDEKHRINYCMKIITENIDFIDNRSRAIERSKKVLTNIYEEQDLPHAEYITTGKIDAGKEGADLAQRELEERQALDTFDVDDLFT